MFKKNTSNKYIKPTYLEGLILFPNYLHSIALTTPTWEEQLPRSTAKLFTALLHSWQNRTEQSHMGLPKLSLTWDTLKHNNQLATTQKSFSYAYSVSHTQTHKTIYTRTAIQRSGVRFFIFYVFERSLLF